MFLNADMGFSVARPGGRKEEEEELRCHVGVVSVGMFIWFDWSEVGL